MGGVAFSFELICTNVQEDPSVGAGVSCLDFSKILNFYVQIFI